MVRGEESFLDVEADVKTRKVCGFERVAYNIVSLEYHLHLQEGQLSDADKAATVLYAKWALH